MNKTEIIETLQKIISNVSDIPTEEIHPDSALMDDLELSSLEVLTIVAEVEKQYKLRIPQKVLRSIISLEDLADYLAAQ